MVEERLAASRYVDVGKMTVIRKKFTFGWRKRNFAEYCAARLYGPNFPMNRFPHPRCAVRRGRIAAAALGALLLAPMFFLSGCYMTPEDKAFYGRGWINPDELDVDKPPPPAFNDPTAIEPHMMGPGEY
jgi:hypothetical protein